MSAGSFAGTGKAERGRRARLLLNQVELPQAVYTRKPGKLSGGDGR